jgi:hypothetical protein
MGIATAMMAVAAVSAFATAPVGQTAPDFSLTDTRGKTRTLSEFKGRVVVLEWVNPECPFVVKHYDSGNMPRLQKTYAAKGVVWLSVNSGAPGNEGAYSPADSNAWLAREGAAPTALLLDPTGKVGHLYGATNTPDMFVINREGVLVYAGAIDSIRSANPGDIARATNYVAAALDNVLDGRAVTKSRTTPYGCSVKY